MKVDLRGREVRGGFVHLERVHQSRGQVLLRLEKKGEYLSDVEQSSAVGAVLGTAAVLQGLGGVVQEGLGLLKDHVLRFELVENQVGIDPGSLRRVLLRRKVLP